VGQWHADMTCEKFAATIKNRDEEQYQQWVKANAKPCPRCHANIEKNGGCTSVGSQLLPRLRVAGCKLTSPLAWCSLSLAAQAIT